MVLRIENDEIVLKVPFPYYWLKRIEKRKQIKMEEVPLLGAT
jgi:hypothetical protein